MIIARLLYSVARFFGRCQGRLIYLGMKVEQLILGASWLEMVHKRITDEMEEEEDNER